MVMMPFVLLFITLSIILFLFPVIMITMSMRPMRHKQVTGKHKNDEKEKWGTTSYAKSRC